MIINDNCCIKLVPFVISVSLLKFPYAFYLHRQSHIHRFHQLDIVMFQIWFPAHYICCINITVNSKEHQSNISPTQCNLLVCYSYMNFCNLYQWCAGFGSYTFPRIVITNQGNVLNKQNFPWRRVISLNVCLYFSSVSLTTCWLWQFCKRKI